MSASNKDIFTTSNSDLGEMSAEQTIDKTQSGEAFDIFNTELEDSHCGIVLNNKDSSKLSEASVSAMKKTKDKLKWQGDYNELCQFVDGLQLQPGSCMVNTRR